MISWSHTIVWQNIVLTYVSMCQRLQLPCGNAVFSSYVFDYADYDIPHAMIIKADLCQMTLAGAENYMTTTIHRHIQSRYETKRNLHARE